MNPNISRLAMLVAAMQLSKRELRSLVSDLLETNPEEFERLVRMYSEMASSPTTILFDEDVMYPESRVYHASSDVGVRVERLLKVEAGLGTQEAVSLLSDALAKRGLIRPTEIPPLSKSRFPTGYRVFHTKLTPS